VSSLEEPKDFFIIKFERVCEKARGQGIQSIGSIMSRICHTQLSSGDMFLLLII